MKTGIELIAEERQKQIEKHGRTVELDVKQNHKRQLRDATMKLICITAKISDPPIDWNFSIWDKMRNKPIKERLIIAGALIAAELDRLNHID